MALVTTAPGIGTTTRRVAVMLGLFGSALLFGDGVITPAQTRRVLGLALAACLEAPVAETVFPVFRM